MNKQKFMAVMSYFSFFVYIPIMTQRHDGWVMEHAKQGLMLFFLEVLALIYTTIPVIGKMTGWIFWSFCFVVMIVGIVQAIRGKEFVMPIFGNNAKKWTFKDDSLLP